MSDLELEQRALEACGYRVHVKERNGTRWLMAVKGLGVRYEHWHPLSNINQAMQLLIDADFNVSIGTHWTYVETEEQFDRVYTCDQVTRDAKALLDAQCRAIVTACASLKPVR